MSNIIESLEKNLIKFENKKISVIIDDDGTPWFNGNEIAVALGYDAPKKAISNSIDNDDKMKLENINTNVVTDKHPHSIYINESGLYSLIIQSRLPKAQKFKSWITKSILPSIRKFGFYRQKQEYENEFQDLMKKINYLKKENENMKEELKNDNFPNGGLVYAIDYSENGNEIYRVGKSDDMKARKSIYDTHILYKKSVIFVFETDCPIQLETCIRSMLYKFRIINRKSFYEYSKEQIKKAFKTCIKSFECMKEKNMSFDKTIDSLQ
jgi:prophage antirepressor-like protein